MLGGGDEGLFELVAGAEGGEDDLGGGGVELDEMAGEIDDANLPGEVGGEEGCAAGGGERFDEGVDGLIEGKEVATGLGMGDGEGVGVGELVKEERDDAATGAEDVAEADGRGGERGVGEAEEFGEAFGGSHEGVGGDGLVGGDEEEAVGVVAGGGFEEGMGAEDIVGDGGEGILLDEGDVFVGGGVEDDLGTVSGEEVGEEWGVGDAAEDRGWGVAEFAEVAVDLVEGGLGGVEEDERLGYGSEAFGQG